MASISLALGVGIFLLGVFLCKDFLTVKSQTIQIDANTDASTLDDTFNLIGLMIESRLNTYGVAIIIAILTGMLGFYGGYQKLIVTSRELVEKELKEIVNGNAEAIAHYVDLAHIELKLFQEARILVLAYKKVNEDRSENELEKYFDLSKVIKKRPDFQPVSGSGVKDINYKKYDLILISDEDKTFFEQKSADKSEKDKEEGKKRSLVIDYINKMPAEICVFYFGPGYINPELIMPARKNLLSYANVKSQIYGNLLNLLKLKDMGYRG